MFVDIRLNCLPGTGVLAARLNRVRVVRDAETELASDRYPVLAKFDLGPGR
ncbi:hypothetical protein [Micromonospora sp. LOL_024]|uniref:hypothetical protein n=1 Tax=Micromonospora sp. LOL_024 TaxID=3345412 RepID=UPI003A8A07F1